MKCGQVECKQNKAGHMPLAEQQGKHADEYSVNSISTTLTAGLCPFGFECTRASDECVCAWVATSVLLHICVCRRFHMGTECVSGLYSVWCLYMKERHLSKFPGVFVCICLLHELYIIPMCKIPAYVLLQLMCQSFCKYLLYSPCGGFYLDEFGVIQCDLKGFHKYVQQIILQFWSKKT